MALVMSVAACGSARTAIEGDPHAGQHELTFHNETSGTVCAVHIFPEGETAEGDSWLPARTEVASGAKYTFWIEPGTYQVRVVGCPRERLQVNGFAPQVIMNRAGVVVLFAEDNPASAQAATALAHANPNSTRIPVKITINRDVPPPKGGK